MTIIVRIIHSTEEGCFRVFTPLGFDNDSTTPRLTEQILSSQINNDEKKLEMKIILRLTNQSIDQSVI